MKRLDIQGKPKKSYDYCPVCKNGKRVSKEQYFQTDMKGNTFKEHICAVCTTRYNQSYIPLGIVVENYIAETISLSDYRGWLLSDGASLTMTNASYHMIRIGLQMKKEIKMWKEEREVYNNTGVCKSHTEIKSHPFKTAEGTFQVNCCPICMKASINYKGITYNDTVMNLVRFIAHNGIEFAKTKSVALPSFDIEMLKEAEKATIELPNWNVQEEELDWGRVTPVIEW